MQTFFPDIPGRLRAPGKNQNPIKSGISQKPVLSSDPKVKGFNGISIVRRDTQIDEKRVRELVKKAQGKE